MKKYIAIIILLIAFTAYAFPPTPPTVNITGNAATATALASNPTDCAANAVATAIDASGNLTCGYALNADIQAYDADLDTWAGITPSTDVQTMLGSANATAIRSNIGLGTIATQNADNATITGGTISGTTVTVSDTISMSVDWGMDSIMSAPDAAIKAQGNVGANIAANATAANVTYSTFTAGEAGNVTTAVYSAGTETATMTLANLVVGKIYHWFFTPTVTGQVPTITATSGVGQSTIPTVVSATVENIYFRATATSAVFTFTNTAASTWSAASTGVYEYSRPAIVREFSNSTLQTLVFDWLPPADWNGGTIKITPYMVVTNATAPAESETVIWSFSGYCVGDSGSLSQSIGTAVTSTYTAPATLVQYDEAIGLETNAITLAGAGAGKKCRIIVDRLTSGTYAQKIGLSSISVKLTRTMAP